MSALLKEIRLSYVGGVNELITGLFVLTTDVLADGSTGAVAAH